MLTPPPQVGTHARLIGYDSSSVGNRLEVVLYWEVLQTLLPPHQVFFHLTAPDGTILAQDDGTPGRHGAFAPTGTWLPGEFITDPHRLTLPADLPADVQLRTGLYVLAGDTRLPVTVDGTTTGNVIILPLHQAE